MQSTLPAAEHATVLASLCDLASGDTCVCGAKKKSTPQIYPFCQDCCNRLHRTDMDRSLNWVYWSMHRPGREFEWQLFEQCTDVLMALHAGRYDGKRKHRSLENASEWN